MVLRIDLKMNLNLQLSLWSFAVLLYCCHAQPAHYAYPTYSRHDHYTYHRAPYLQRAASHMHLTRSSPRGPFRPVKRNFYQTMAASKPRAYWNPAAAPYQHYHPRRQSLVASPNRSPVKVIYAPLPVSIPVSQPQIVFAMASPQRHAPKGEHTLPKSTSSADMISSGSDSSNVQYIPVVKKVTHHHIHHIVASPKSRLHLSDQQNVEQLSNLLKSLINKQKASSSIDSINLFADGSSQVPIKIDSTEQDTKPLEVESEDEVTKNINHEIVFEDEDEDEPNKGEGKQFVHVIEPETRKPKNIDSKKKTPKKTVVYKIKPEKDLKEKKIITVHDLVKSAVEKPATGKGPYYSLFLGVPEGRKSTKTTEQLEDFSESTYEEADDQEFEIDANRRIDVDKSNFKATKLKKKDSKIFEKLMYLSNHK